MLKRNTKTQRHVMLLDIDMSHQGMFMFMFGTMIGKSKSLLHQKSFGVGLQKSQPSSTVGSRAIKHDGRAPWGKPGLPPCFGIASWNGLCDKPRSLERSSEHPTTHMEPQIQTPRSSSVKETFDKPAMKPRRRRSQTHAAT